MYRDVLVLTPADAAALPVVLADCRRRGAVEEAIGFANRALAIEPDNFVALQTLGWAHVSQGNHQAAQPVIERALKRFDELRMGDPSTVLRIVGAAFGLAARVPALRRRFPKLVQSTHVAAVTAEELNEWKVWARRYLEWHSHEFGQTRRGTS